MPARRRRSRSCRSRAPGFPSTLTMSSGTISSAAPACLPNWRSAFGIGLVGGGDQHDALAAPLVRHRDGRVVLLRPQRLHQHLDRAQRHHLAGDLGEALGAAANADEALAVDRHDVAGVVPAIVQRLQLARAVGGHVAHHHVRPGEPQPAAFGDALDRLELHAHAGQQAPDRAVAAMDRGVDGDHRRRLGQAETLDDLGAEALAPDAPRLGASPPRRRRRRGAGWRNRCPWRCGHRRRGRCRCRT